MNRISTGIAAFGLLFTLVLGGCSPVRIKCVVLEGELSTIAVVSSSDPRFDEPGVAGAEIVVRQTGRAGDVIIRKTNERGRATIPLAGTGALSRPLSVEASAEGYIPARIAQMPTPTPGQGLLILIEPIGAIEP
ncbi:MAG: hypothetical protein AAF937_02155 [Planctomycetota bacterium]